MRTLHAAAKRDFPIFPERLHQPGSRKYYIIKLMIFRPDPRRLEKIPKHVSTSRLCRSYLPNINNFIPSYFLPGPGHSPRTDVFALIDHVKVHMPAAAPVCRLDHVKPALDPAFEDFAKFAERNTHPTDIILREISIRHVPRREGHKVDLLPALRQLDQGPEVMSEPFTTADWTGSVPTIQLDLDRMSTMGAADRHKPMIFFFHAFT
jgi:hypothetical protein